MLSSWIPFLVRVPVERFTAERTCLVKKWSFSMETQVTCSHTNWTAWDQLKNVSECSFCLTNKNNMATVVAVRHKPATDLDTQWAVLRQNCLCAWFRLVRLKHLILVEVFVFCFAVRNATAGVLCVEFCEAWIWFDSSTMITRSETLAKVSSSCWCDNRSDRREPWRLAARYLRVHQAVQLMVEWFFDHFFAAQHF